MGKGEACEQCKHNYLRIHGKNMTSPPIMSFIKIMIGANFPKFMYLPPKFGRTVSNLVGEKVNLEDANGHQWVVTVRNVDNSIAFKQGWPAFSSDHGLNFGDFVIFHYLSETSFFVKVYDNSGCEKTNFPSKGYPSKRPRTEEYCISEDAPKCHTNENIPKKGYQSKKPRNGENIIAKDGPKCHTSDKSSINKQDSNTFAAKSDIEMNQNHYHMSNPSDIEMNQNHYHMSNPSHIEMDQNHCDTINLHKNPSNCVTSSGKPLPVFRPNSIEESFIMINRDLGIKKEEDRTTSMSMFDLSNFEMPSNVAFVNRISVRSSPKKSDLLMESQTRACTMSQDPVAVPEIFLAKDSCNKKTTETTSVWKPDGDKEDEPDMVIKRCQFEKPSVNISNEPLLGDNQIFSEPLFGENQIDASKMYQTQCRIDNLNSLQEATEVSDISRFPAPSRLQNYQKEDRDNQDSASKMYQTSRSEASPNIIPDGTEVPEILCFSVCSEPHNYSKDEMMVFQEEKIGVSVTQEFADLTPERSYQDEMIQGISGKGPKTMKGPQSQSFSPTINGAMKVVKNEPINTEIPRFAVSSRPQDYCKDKMKMGNKQEKIGLTQEFIDLTQELDTREEMIQGISGKASEIMKGYQSHSFSQTINEAVKVVKSESTDTEIPCSSISSRLRNRRDKMMMDFKRKIGFTKEFVGLTPERYSREEMIQGNESKFMKGSQSQSFSSTINEAVKMAKIEPIVKNERIETDDSSSSFLSLSCLVSTNTRSFFELPSCLPPFKGKTKYCNTVCLEDSVMRRWPVVYHERYNLQVLTTGWEAFSRANRIQQGDECVFQLENSEDAIFTVRIIRRF